MAQQSWHQLTVGEFAHQTLAIVQKKIAKQEQAVLQDSDPEPLHQMRVGMRRLRTILQVFQTTIVLPKSIHDRSISKMAKILGAVRDADVLLGHLEQYRLFELPKAEQKALRQAIAKLQKQRVRDFAKIQQLLAGEDYPQFQKALTRWLQQPTHAFPAQYPLREVLPDLLMPILSELLLHPGWLVGTVPPETSQRTKATSPSPGGIPLELTPSEIIQIHDLRKQMKRLRYQSELFQECFGTDYKTQLNDFKTIQDLLGQLQDIAVLNDFLGKALQADPAQILPTLTQHLNQNRNQLLHHWLPIRDRYCEPQFRQTLRQLFLHPSLPDSKATEPESADGTLALEGVPSPKNKGRTQRTRPKPKPA